MIVPVFRSASTRLPRLHAAAAATAVVPRAMGASIGEPRMFSLGSDLQKKEKVEEDRYIRAKEHKAYMKRKAAEDAAAAALEPTPEEKEWNATIGEVFILLEKTGNMLNDEGVESIAKWKLGRE